LEKHEKKFKYLFDYDNSRFSTFLEVNYSTSLLRQSLDPGSYTVFRKGGFLYRTQTSGGSKRRLRLRRRRFG
jgi:hypothetical protein